MGLYILLMGVQGAGKGTQAPLLVEKYSIPHISTGDLFRAMRTLETPLAKEIQALMAEGKLIPDDVTNRVVEDRLSQPDTQGGAIFDGYPRSTGQAQWFDDLLAGRGEKIGAVIVLQLDAEIAIKRAEGRRYSQDMKRVYNVYFNPPQNKDVDDLDGQPLIQRKDDHLDAVTERIDTFFKTTAPLIEYYRHKGVVCEIDASRSVELVHQSIVEALEAVRSK